MTGTASPAAAAAPAPRARNANAGTVASASRRECAARDPARVRVYTHYFYYPHVSKWPSFRFARFYGMKKYFEHAIKRAGVYGAWDVFADVHVDAFCAIQPSPDSSTLS
ncbi:hypothetical protein EVAR_103799_1 [Eumeta japonica]|uniref:Uncharacterized protein n=1 Tax=Eumeta variegata TaxID=151549 RepID=A0A4C1Z3E7_EUMVA|nr:hypothetical protein EVAR_103799_1 [Eumeta japonica]